MCFLEVFQTPLFEVQWVSKIREIPTNFHEKRRKENVLFLRSRRKNEPEATLYLPTACSVGITYL